MTTCRLSTNVDGQQQPLRRSTTRAGNVDESAPLIDGCCAPGAAPIAPEAAEQLAARFKALSDPTRVRIVNLPAASHEVCVCVLNEEFDLSQPTISHHLKLLREAGIVDSDRRGTWAFYRLVPDALDELRAALSR